MKKIFFWAGIFLWLILSVIGCEWLGSKKSKKQKLIIVGIDAGTWKIILPLLRESRLLNFQSLIENSREEEKKESKQRLLPWIEMIKKLKAPGYIH